MFLWRNPMIFDNNGKLILKEVDEFLKTYYMSTGVSILALNDTGQTIVSYGESYKFCDFLHESIDINHNCKEVHLKSCELAINIGEPYFFYCPFDFVHIAVPLLNDGIFLGGIIAGPIIMNPQSAKDEKERILDDLPSNTDLQALSRYYDNISIADPIRINYLGNMLFMMASKEMDNYQNFLDEKKIKMTQQSRINDIYKCIKRFQPKIQL